MYFYKCKENGAILISSQPASGCQDLEEMIPNATDAAGEKHVPVIRAEGGTVTVTVGSVEHPMLPAHFIQWIILETSAGFHRKDLLPGEKPEAEFILSSDEKAVAAYELCNLHGLWKAES